MPQKIPKIKRMLIEFIAQFLPPCNRTTQLLSASRDRRLTVGEWLKLKLHLQFCQWCTDYGHQISIIDEAFQRQARAPETTPVPTQKLPDAALRKIKQAISNESKE